MFIYVNVVYRFTGAQGVSCIFLIYLFFCFYIFVSPFVILMFLLVWAIGIKFEL
jgi:hypothetical protein